MDEQFLIDTSSLLSLVRYYQPFDKSGILEGFVKEKFENGEFILLKSVFDECKRVSRGIVIKEYPFLKDLNIKQINNMIATAQQNKKMYDCSGKGWRVDVQKEELDEAEFQAEKKEYTNSADFHLIATAASKSNMTIVTEETTSINDGKPFKKIPVICRIEGIRCINLPELLKKLSLSVNYQVANYSKRENIAKTV